MRSLDKDAYDRRAKAFTEDEKKRVVDERTARFEYVRELQAQSRLKQDRARECRETRKNRNEFQKRRAQRDQADDEKSEPLSDKNKVLQGQVKKEDKEPQDQVEKEDKEPQGQVEKEDKEPQDRVKKEDKQPQGQPEDPKSSLTIYSEIASKKTISQGDRGPSESLRVLKMKPCVRCIWCFTILNYPLRIECGLTESSIIERGCRSDMTRSPEKEQVTRFELGTFEAEAIGCAEVDTYIQESRIKNQESSDREARESLLNPMPVTDGGSYSSGDRAGL